MKLESAGDDRRNDAGRPYRMRARQHAVEQTRERILQAMADLWLERHYDEVSLSDVAERAGVSRQTVYRQFGSKEDLLVATAEWKGPQSEADRMSSPGDTDEAIRRLVAEHELMGDAVIRTLELEGRVQAMDHMLKRGRTGHRSWIEHVFGPHLPAHGDRDREHMILSLYAATDVTTWKLLRRDFDLPRPEVERIIHRLVTGVLPPLPESS